MKFAAFTLTSGLGQNTDPTPAPPLADVFTFSGSGDPQRDVSELRDPTVSLPTVDFTSVVVLNEGGGGGGGGIVGVRLFSRLLMLGFSM